MKSTIKQKEKLLENLITWKVKRPLRVPVHVINHAIETVCGGDAYEFSKLALSLKGDGLIESICCSESENDFKITAVILSESAIGYFDRKRQENINAIKTWTMNITIALLSSLFGAFLARLSMVLFP